MIPPLSRLFLLTALFFLLLGFTFGAVVLLTKAGLFPPWGYALLPLHIVATGEGWVLLMIMGVAYWIFPRFQGGGVRGREREARLAWICLTGGLTLRLIGYGFRGRVQVETGGILLEFLGILFFLYHILPRIKPVSKTFITKGG